MMTSAHFTEQQANDLVGHYVRARIHFSGIPGGALGVIAEAREGDPGWRLYIAWNVPPLVKKQTDTVAFARGDFERALERLAE